MVKLQEKKGLVQVNIKRILKQADLLITTVLFVLSVYELYIRLTANDKVDKPFNIYDQIDLNDIGQERSD